MTEVDWVLYLTGINRLDQDQRVKVNPKVAINQSPRIYGFSGFDPTDLQERSGKII